MPDEEEGVALIEKTHHHHEVKGHARSITPLRKYSSIIIIIG